LELLPLYINVTFKKFWVRSHSSSLKIIPLESLATVSYSHSAATMALSVAVSGIFRVK